MGLRRLEISNPTADTDTTLFTADNQYLMSVIATNLSASASDISVWVEPSGSSASADYAYIVYDLPVDAKNSYETFRFAVNQNDEVHIQTNSSDMSFQSYGLVQFDVNLGVGISSYSNSEPLNPIQGLLWVDSSENDVLKIYNGSSWSIVKQEESRYLFVASGGETSFSGIDDNGNTLVYQPGYEKVFLNGVLLLRGSDYVATNGTSISGLESLTAGYSLEVFSV